MAHSYSHLFELPITMFRFFTVYGPWGRPDMAPYKFTNAILRGLPIEVFNHGKMKRDFTYIDDIVESIRLLMHKEPNIIDFQYKYDTDSISPVAPYRVVNIGNAQPIELSQFIRTIEDITNVEAKQNFMPMQPGDVKSTWANTSLLKDLIGYVPETTLEIGMQNYIEWFKDYYLN